MAPLMIGVTGHVPLPTCTPIIEAPKVQGPTQNVERFDPKKHLAYGVPSKTYTMRDLGYSEDTGVSPVAVSGPFPLFTTEAIEVMRAEILRPEIQDKFKYSSNIAPCQLRGYAKNYAPFTYEAWNHPETLVTISKIAGIEVVPVFDYEIGHINFSVKSETEIQQEIDMIKEREHIRPDGCGNNGPAWEDYKPIVGWHTDSYPFVCVVMMSDCTNMIGGETAVRAADGKIFRVRCPSKGCAVVLQGRYITHQAMQALGMQERISSVTSFRPKSPFLKDDTELRTVRPVSDLSELYYGFAEYRLANLEALVRRALEEMAIRRKNAEKFDIASHKEFLGLVKAFIHQSDNEIRDESEVQMGVIDSIDIPDVAVIVDETRSAE